jgi:cytochrome d ubiquinol oxidase subunit II
LVSFSLSFVLPISLACYRIGREGCAFVFSGATVIATVAVLFLALFPNVMPSSIASAYNLTTENAASSPYTLKIMTWVAVVMPPIVLCYQGWTYWVFRKRIGTRHIPTSVPHGAAG